MQEKDQELVTVLQATSRDEAMIAVSMLEAEGIKYLVTGDGFRDLEGYGILGIANIGARPIMIRVLEEDREHAIEVLQPLLEQTEVIDEETLARIAEEAGSSEADE